MAYISYLIKYSKINRVMKIHRVVQLIA